MKRRINLQILCFLSALAMPLLPGGSVGFAQQATQKKETARSTQSLIMGTVVDDDGEPLPGASVRVKGAKGANSGTMTDSKGMFGMKWTIPASGKVTLIVSYVGMKKQEVPFDFKKTARIVMSPDASVLSEVTVVDDGYNRLPRKDMVGAYTTIKAEDIMMPAYQSIDQMLQGKVAGMVVENSSARVGTSPSIKIRGVSTFMGNTDPLWVVDGVIQADPLRLDVSSTLTEDMRNLIGNQISWLNPQDIETITVLKDASATAIYGSKASNGVIVITTKKGSADRVAVRYSTNVSIRERATYKNYDFMNSLERINFAKEAYDAGVRYQNEPLPQIYTYEGLMAMFNKRMITEDQFAKYMQRIETVNTDWLDLLTRNSVSTSHNVSVSGGNNKVTYSTSFGYSTNKGTEIGNDNSQFTSRANIGIKFTPKFTVNVNLNGSFRESFGYGPGVSPQSYALKTSRALPAFNEDGSRAYYKNYYYYPLNSNQLELGYNILSEMENTSAKNMGKNFSTSLNADYKLFPWLTYQFVGSMTQSGNNSEAFAGEKSTYIERNYRGYAVGSEESGSNRYKAALMPHGGEMTSTASNSASYSMSHKLQFSNTYADVHRINALGGFEMRSTDYNSITNTVWGYVPERGKIIVQPTPPAQIVPIGKSNTYADYGVLQQLYNGKWRTSQRTDNYLSFFGVLAYSFDSRYVFNANFRSDASNRFGQDTNKQFNPTYSFGFSWRMADEKFISENLTWLNQLNLRATYGIQGNVVNSISPDLIASYGGLLGGYNEYYVTISSLPNPHLSWESTKSWNLGFDLQFLNSVTMNFEYYGRRSNAILRQEIAEEYGQATMNLNGGMIYNHGIEWTANFTPIATRDFVWTVGVNASQNWNTSENEDGRIKADKLQKSDFLSGNSSQPLRKGYPVNAFWSYSFAGLDPATGYPTFNYLNTGGGNADVDPLTFLVYSGQRDSYFTGGINTRIRYKDFSIGTSFTALMGAKKRLPNPYGDFNQGGKLPDPYYNLPRELNNRWKQPGDELKTTIPALFTSTPTDYYLSTPDGLAQQSRYEMWAMSDAMVADASFLRCNQIQASYYLPKSICQKFGAQQLSFSATMNNVFILASKRWNGFDPELGSSTQPHIYSLGLSVSF